MGSSSKRHDKIDLKKHVKTTAVYFSVQDKVDLKKHVKATTTAVYFSVQNKVYLKNREDYSGLLFRTAVRFVWRIAPKHLMTMTADQLSVDLGCHCVFLVFAGLSTTCTSPSDASPTLLFFGGGLSSPAKSTISQPFWATRSAKELPAPPPTVLFSVELKSSPAYLAF